MNARIVLGISAAFALIASTAFAESDADKTMARALGKEGTDALARKDYATALDRFSRAEKLYHAPTLLLGLAESLAGSGKLISALETYNRLARETLPAGAPGPFKEAVATAKKEAVALEPRIPSVVVEVTGAPSPTVTIDGDPIPSAALGAPRPVDPGTRTVRAEASGFSPAEQTVKLDEGKTVRVKLELKSVAPAAPSSPESAPVPAAGPPPSDTAARSGGTQRTVGWVALGVGATGLVVGGVTGVMFLGKKSELDDNCPGGQCPPDRKSTHDAYKSLSLVSGIGFVVGVVGASAGATLLLTAPKDATFTAIVPFVSPQGGGIAGRF
jgi:hypothetical protein